MNISNIEIIIALFLAYLAYQNYRLQRDSLRFNLYERRYATYQTIQKYLSLIVQKGTIDNTDMNEFNREAYKNEFLFGHEIKEYVDEIWKKSCKLKLYEDLLKEEPVGKSRTKICEDNSEILGWIHDQFETSRKLFNKYLRISIFSLDFKIKKEIKKFLQ
jgi:hypothetical protein